MNLYLAEYHCSDFRNPEDTMDITGFEEIDFEKGLDLMNWAISENLYVEDPWGFFITNKKFGDLKESCLAGYIEDLKDFTAHQYLIIAAEDMETADDIAEIHSWHYILELKDEQDLLD